MGVPSPDPSLLVSYVPTEPIFKDKVAGLELNIEDIVDCFTRIFSVNYTEPPMDNISR